MRLRKRAQVVGLWVGAVAAVAVGATASGEAVTAQGAPSPVIAGCPVFPATNVWNRPVDDLPVAANSDAIIHSIGYDTPIVAGFGAGLVDGSPIGIPFDVVRASTMVKSRVHFDYPRDSDRALYPIPSNVAIEPASDRHAVIIDRDSCRLYELFDLRWDKDHWDAGSGAIWNLRSNRLRPPGLTSADAAGLPILPGLARWQGDASTGQVDHALRFSVGQTRRAYVYPARHFASGSTDPSLPPMGLRVRLRADVDISGLPPQARIIAQAMKTYGMIVADNGPSWHVSGAPSPHWSNVQLKALSTLTGGDFEVVDTSNFR